jgi:hypothetical protein
VLLKRTQPPPEPGHEVVRRELEELNRRFSHLASIILERRNMLQVLIQNWKRQQQVRLGYSWDCINTNTHCYDANYIGIHIMDSLLWPTEHSCPHHFRVL